MNESYTKNPKLNWVHFINDNPSHRLIIAIYNHQDKENSLFQKEDK